MSEKTELPLVALHTQEAVLLDYKGTRALRNDSRAADKLHMFFSPWRIPVGLTDNEVALCVLLYPYKVRMIKRINEIEDAKIALLNPPLFPQPTLTDALELINAGIHDNINDATNHLEFLWEIANRLILHPIRIFPLPRELSPSEVMTRERFRLGIRKFISQYRSIFTE